MLHQYTMLCYTWYLAMLCYTLRLTACFLARLCRVSSNAESHVFHTPGAQGDVRKQHHNAMVRDIDDSNAAREKMEGGRNVLLMMLPLLMLLL